MEEDVSPLETLAEARRHLKEKRVELAGRMFLSLKHHPRWGYLAHYGIGLCFIELRALEHGLAAFEQAFLLAKKPFIAVAILETLTKMRKFEALAGRTLKMVGDFSDSEAVVGRLRRIYEISLRSERGDSRGV